MCYSLPLKLIIAEKIYTLYWKLTEQQILCENKSFKMFILYLINAWGGKRSLLEAGIDTNTSAKIMYCLNNV